MLRFHGGYGGCHGLVDSTFTRLLCHGLHQPISGAHLIAGVVLTGVGIK